MSPAIVWPHESTALLLAFLLPAPLRPFLLLLLLFFCCCFLFFWFVAVLVFCLFCCLWLFGNNLPSCHRVIIILSIGNTQISILLLCLLYLLFVELMITTNEYNFVYTKVLLTLQTHTRFKGTLFLRTKHNMRIFGVIPFIKLKKRRSEKPPKMRWGAKSLMCFCLVQCLDFFFFFFL